MRYINIKLLVIGLALMAMFSRCTDDLDSIRPKNAVAQSDISASDIASLRIGMYALMEDFVFDSWFDFDNRAVNFKGGPGFTISGDPINIRPSDADIYARWTKAYTTLNKINFLITTIEGTATPATYNTTKGEALYFRSLIFYNLAARWGGVPILTKQTYNVVPRSTEEQVWAQIKTDLTAAETIVSASFTSSLYVSAPAVQALLARVYLATKDKANAIVYCDKLINNTKFALATDAMSYSSIFSAGGASKELVFAFANNSTSNPHLFYQAVNDIDGSWNYSATDALYSGLYADKSIAKGDKRKASVFSTDKARIIKFPNGNASQQLAATTNANLTPMPVSRIAEIYLIKAEAQGAGVASTTLAGFMSKRYDTAPDAAALSALGEKELQDLILDERLREFYGEGQRWFDVKRTGRTDLFPTLAGRTHLMYYPIPQTEIDLGGYIQNAGYN